MAEGDAVGGTVGFDGPADDASNRLVLAPTMNDRARRTYFEQLLPDSPADYDVLSVDYRRRPDRVIEEWQRHLGERPGRYAIVTVDESTRSAAASGLEENLVRRDSRTVVCVESPADLTGLGITVSDYLERYGGPETLVTFDSLTVLLQYVDLQRAFRFLHVLSNRIEATGATALYQMDPGAHETQAVATLSSVFDVVFEFEDDDADPGWTRRGA